MKRGFTIWQCWVIQRCTFILISHIRQYACLIMYLMMTRLDKFLFFLIHVSWQKDLSLRLFILWNVKAPVQQAHSPAGAFCCTLTKSAPHWWLSFPLLPSLNSVICSDFFRWLSISRSFIAPMPLAPSTERCFWSSVQLNAYNRGKQIGKKQR